MSKSDPEPTGGPPLDEGGGPSVFTDERDPAERILVALSQIGATLRTSTWERAAPRGLNPTQVKILSSLLRIEDPGASLAHLAAQLGVSPPTVSDSVSALERKGLVQKKPRAEDGRSLAISLTRAGRTAARDLSDWPDELIGTMDSLTPDEHGALLRSLSKVVRQLQVSGQIATARTCVTCRFFRPHVHDDPLTPHHCLLAEADFGDLNLRLDCQEHEPADEALADTNWEVFSGAG